MDRLILRQYVLGFSFTFMVLGLTLMAFLGVQKDILYAIGAMFSPAMLLAIKGLIDSDESNEDKEE